MLTLQSMQKQLTDEGEKTQLRVWSTIICIHGGGGGRTPCLPSPPPFPLPQTRQSLLGVLWRRDRHEVEWIMAELVRNQDMQKRLVEEIEREEDLHRAPHLKAVILEGLRRHPPAHFLVPHVATEDVEVRGYVVPANAAVNFMVADMGWDDEKVWKEPMERLLEGGDVMGSPEIKMMPFGVGRRICPGIGLALLALGILRSSFG